MKDLLSIAKLACHVAVREGAEFVDVHAQRGKHVSVELEKCAIKSSDVRWTGGVSIRTFVKGGMGSASTDSVKEKDLVQTAENAAALAKASEPDPDFVSLPAPAPYQPVEGLFDEKIAEMGVDQVMEYAVMNIDAARSVVDDVLVSGGAGCGFSEHVLVNSLGVEVASKSSFVSAGIFAIIKRGDDVGSFFEFDYGRRLCDFDPEGIGVKATEGARSFLGARKIETATLPIVLGPLTSSNLFSTLCWNANGEDIQRNRSYLIGMKGKRVASDLVTIIDDGLYPAGMSSGSLDEEGFPRRKLVVVEKGILRSYLYNSYTANKAKEENTGHAARGGISPTNVRPKPCHVRGDHPGHQRGPLHQYGRCVPQLGHR